MPNDLTMGVNCILPLELEVRKDNEERGVARINGGTIQTRDFVVKYKKIFYLLFTNLTYLDFLLHYFFKKYSYLKSV